MSASLFSGKFVNHPVSGDRTVEVDVSGVNTSYAYFGMVFMSVIAVLIFTGTKNPPFTPRIEDKGLCSVNYTHFGGNKVWYDDA
jgi:hypothetical protein